MAISEALHAGRINSDTGRISLNPTRTPDAEISASELKTAITFDS